MMSNTLQEMERLAMEHEALRAQLAERDAEIARLRQQVDAWQATGNAIMLCAVGREAPLSDSDVCGEINALRQQVAELQAWKAAVPVDALRRYIPSSVSAYGVVPYLSEYFEDNAAIDEWFNCIDSNAGYPPD